MEFPTLFEDFEPVPPKEEEKKPAPDAPKADAVENPPEETGTALTVFDRKYAASLLRERAIRDQTSLDRELDEIRRRPVSKLGEQLLKEGFINERDLHEALASQKAGKRKKIGDVLLEMGAISKDAMDIVLYHRLGIPLLKLRTIPSDQTELAVEGEAFPVEREALALVPQIVAQKFTLIPCAFHRGKLVVAMENPTDPDALRELHFKSGKNIVPVYAERDDIAWAIEHHYIKKQKHNPWIFKV